MPVAKLTCPKCAATLKPAKPVEEGKKVKCPKCATVFAAKGDGKTAPAAAAGKTAKKVGAAAKTKPDANKPAAPLKHYEDPEDDGLVTYDVIRDPDLEDNDEDEEYEDDEDENEDEEGESRPKKRGSRKPKINYTPDLAVTDPRGPAQAKVIPPSNGLLFSSLVTVILSVLVMGWCVWPMIFADRILEAKDVYPKIKDRANKPKDREYKDLTKEEQWILDEENVGEFNFRWWVFGAALFVAVYNGFVTYGAVKMQNLESYRWAMTASIMGLLPVSLSFLGFAAWSLATLRKEPVPAGFEARMTDIFNI